MGESRDFDDPKYVAWRKAVYARDGHRCRMPGCRRNRHLNAHHIQRWADAPLLRFVVANGITLCPRCHKRVNGKEEDFIVQFSGIIASSSPGGNDVRLLMIMAKYAPKTETGRPDLHGGERHP